MVGGKVKEFTPGPWKVQRYDNGNSYAISPVGSAKVIAKLQSKTFDNKANAHLIAAAPEMYEALKEIYQLLEKHEPHWYLRKHYNLVAKALAKAEGKE